MIEQLSDVLEIPVDTLLSNEEKKQLRKDNRNKRIIIVCVVFFIIAMVISAVYLMRPTGIYIKRIFVLAGISLYLMIFIFMILYIGRGEKDETCL